LGAAQITKRNTRQLVKTQNASLSDHHTTKVDARAFHSNITWASGYLFAILQLISSELILIQE
jgi:hypothetical protein